MIEASNQDHKIIVLLDYLDTVHWLGAGEAGSPHLARVGLQGEGEADRPVPGPHHLQALAGEAGVASQGGGGR